MRYPTYYFFGLMLLSGSIIHVKVSREDVHYSAIKHIIEIEGNIHSEKIIILGLGQGAHMTKAVNILPNPGVRSRSFCAEEDDHA
jgi:hypothetical protein